MSPEEEALATVVPDLKLRGIPYMPTGSVASGYHGPPRATHDADLIIDPTPAQLEGDRCRRSDRAKQQQC